jgi:uncharacterized Zn finger protein (UPF0148 family)
VLPLAYFGINNSGLNLVITLLILFVVVLYLSLVYWTYADARRRILDPMLVGCATLASLFPFVGTLVYMILRPPEYLEDVRERELEMQAAEIRLHQLDHGMCPHCDYQIERDFLRCPSCLRKLKDRCTNCERPLDRAWTICPYCEAEVAGAASPRRTRSRERAAKPAGSPSKPASTTAATRVRTQSDAPTDESDSLLSDEPLGSGAGSSVEQDPRAAVPASKPASRPRAPRSNS